MYQKYEYTRIFLIKLKKNLIKNNEERNGSIFPAPTWSKEIVPCLRTVLKLLG